MLKRFLYMLALAFALQMSWGVASAYCMHETGKASLHFGHHQHEHSPSKDTCCGTGASTPKKIAVDWDCPSCAHSSIGVFAWTASLVEPMSAAHCAPLLLPVLPPPYLGSPERPQWQVAA